MNANTKLIKKAIIDSELSQREIVERIGISESHLSHIIAGRDRSERVARALAELLERPAARLFPYLAQQEAA